MHVYVPVRRRRRLLLSPPQSQLHQAARGWALVVELVRLRSLLLVPPHPLPHRRSGPGCKQPPSEAC